MGDALVRAQQKQRSETVLFKRGPSATEQW